MEKANYTNLKICKECGGLCCKTLPGCALPEDVDEPMLENIIKLFKSGNWALDSWDGELPENNNSQITYYLRPAIKGIYKIFHPSWGGECIFFTENYGCELKPDSRPSGCRLLEPKENNKCISHGAGKLEAAIAWVPYQDVLKAAMLVCNNIVE